MTRMFVLSALLSQLWLAFLAAAAPVAEDIVSSTSHDNAWEYGTGGGILGLIVLILDIIVFSRSFQEECHARHRPDSRLHRSLANLFCV